jgi:stage II sporulation protein D
MRRDERPARWTGPGTVILIALLTGILTTMAGASARRRTAWVPSDPQQADPTVSVRLGLAPPWRVTLASEGRMKGAPLPPGTYHVAWKGSAVRLEGGGREVEASNGLEISCDAPIVVNGRGYRGSLLFRRWSILNRLSLQDYLRGVVGSEIGSKAELEAMKAQTVVARTYTLAHMRGEIADDTSFQVYRGTEVENPTVDQAVDATRGEILTFKGHLAREVCYHSTCGGHTEDNENVFMTAPIPYLRGVPCGLGEVGSAERPAPVATGEDQMAMVPMPLSLVAPTPVDPSPAPLPEHACEDSTWYHWSIRWPAREIPTVVILETSPTGRVVRCSVGGRIYSGDEIRRALRYRDVAGRVRNLYSTAFTLHREGDLLVAEGSGWGHGVGLCQWGARGMARAGVAYTVILAHYFPGTEISTVP